MKRIVCVSDLQVPFHDKKLVRRFTQFLADYKPDEVTFVGDVSDSTEVSRWVKGYKDEHGDLDAALDETHAVLADMRAAVGPDVPMSIERSNHDERVENYIRQYAPGLATLRGLDFPGLVGLEELDISFHRKPIPIAPNTIIMHGDEGRTSQDAGKTALMAAIASGKNVVCGHTHRAGLTHKTESVAGKYTRVLWGLEVGNMMDLAQASYLKSGGANWAQAFGVLHVDGPHVTPNLVLVRRDGSFVVDGVHY